MLAYKTKLNINNEMLFLKIPSNFKGKRVEIIVLETYDFNDTDWVENTNDIETFYETLLITNDESKIKYSNQEPNDFQKILLSSPTWSDNEYQSFLDARKLFNQWKIE